MQADRHTRNTPSEGTYEERFAVRNVRYRWREGVAAAPGAEHEALGKLFHRVVRPSLERRKAPTLQLVVRDGAEPRARWISWSAQGDGAPVWGLYRTQGGGAGEGANDTWELIAWGDGPALAWAHPDADARALLRRALHEPPLWLSAGMASRDPSFPVRFEPLARQPAKRRAAR